MSQIWEWKLVERYSARVVQELHRNKPWASYWLDRYNKEGIEGLKDKQVEEHRIFP
ncbi:MAG TPA: hypothetical protein VFJ51_05555 [Nitrososphaeraceae archaeon]|nr:hypothetical protein [Nitrososphaeraceae archaeon]